MYPTKLTLIPSVKNLISLHLIFFGLSLTSATSSTSSRSNHHQNIIKNSASASTPSASSYSYKDRSKVETLPVRWFRRSNRASKGKALNPPKLNVPPDFEEQRSVGQENRGRNQGQNLGQNLGQNSNSNVKTMSKPKKLDEKLFRPYQTMDWKLKEPFFIPNELTDLIENTTMEESEKLQKVKLLLDEQIETKDLLSNEDKLFINHRDGYALRRASDYGYYHIVKLLIDYGAEVSYLDCEALRLAAQNGHLNIVKELYVEGCRSDSRQEYALRASSKLGHKDVVEFLLGLGADPRTYDGFALACTKDKEIELMLRMGPFL